MFLLETPTWVILLPALLICGLAYFCAKYYSDTNDFKKSLIIYLPPSMLIAIGFRFAGLPFLLGGFMVFAGFVLMMFFSNKFFYEDR
ncbi:MAG: hypothetical protein FWE05_08895 [Defluviitaleaceae bacterium]|nr:hypothetical protein [Defluviitaleaceae bacterium]